MWEWHNQIQITQIPKSSRGHSKLLQHHKQTGSTTRGLAAMWRTSHTGVATTPSLDSSGTLQRQPPLTIWQLVQWESGIRYSAPYKSGEPRQLRSSHSRSFFICMLVPTNFLLLSSMAVHTTALAAICNGVHLVIRWGWYQKGQWRGWQWRVMRSILCFLDLCGNIKIRDISSPLLSHQSLSLTPLTPFLPLSSLPCSQPAESRHSDRFHHT